MKVCLKKFKTIINNKHKEGQSYEDILIGMGYKKEEYAACNVYIKGHIYIKVDKKTEEIRIYHEESKYNNRRLITFNFNNNTMV